MRGRIPLPPLEQPEDFIRFVYSVDPNWLGNLPMRIYIEDRKEAARVSAGLLDFVLSAQGKSRTVTTLQDGWLYSDEPQSGYIQAAIWAFKIAPAYDEDDCNTLYDIGLKLVRAEADLLAASINGPAPVRDAKTGKRIVFNDAMLNPGDDPELQAMLAAKRVDRLMKTGAPIENLGVSGSAGSDGRDGPEAEPPQPIEPPRENTWREEFSKLTPGMKLGFITLSAILFSLWNAYVFAAAWYFYPDLEWWKIAASILAFVVIVRGFIAFAPGFSKKAGYALSPVCLIASLPFILALLALVLAAAIVGLVVFMVGLAVMWTCQLLDDKRFQANPFTKLAVGAGVIAIAGAAAFHFVPNSLPEAAQAHAINGTWK